MPNIKKEVKISIVTLCKTSQGVMRFIESIDTTLAGLYTNKDFKQNLSESIDIVFSDFITRQLASNDIHMDDKAKIKSYLMELKNEARSIHQVKMVLAFHPSSKFIDILFEWVKANIDNDIVINYEVNKEIIGGVTVIYKGKYLDFSSAPFIDRVFVERASYVQELLR